MAVYGPDDIPIGSGGWDIDSEGNLVPKGTTLNTPPPEFATPQGGQLINTPNSSTGAPFRQAPGASSFPTTQQGAPGTLTPNSRTGAPAPGIRNAPPSTEVVPSGQGNPGANDYVNNLIKNYGANYVRQNWRTIAPSLGLSELALPAALATIPLVASTTSTAPKSKDEAPRWSWPVPAGAQVDPFSNPAPVTQTEPKGMMIPPVTGGGGGTPIGPGPEGRGPGMPMGPLAAIPPSNPSAPAATPPLPPSRPKDAGRSGGGRSGGGRSRGGSSPGPAPPMINLQPQPGWTTIDRPNADVAGGRSVAGQLAPQYFNRAREPGGPAQMGAFDFSTLFNHPQVAAAAAAQPAVQAHVAARVAAVRARAPVAGPLAPGVLSGSGSPTPMDIQDRSRGQYPVTSSGSPTPMDIQDRSRFRNTAGLWPQGFL